MDQNKLDCPAAATARAASESAPFARAGEYVAVASDISTFSPLRPVPARAVLARLRGLIDGVDDALVALLAGRRGLVALAAGLKRRSELSLRDPDREREVLQRARRLGGHFGLPAGSSDRLMNALIQDACAQQGLEPGIDGGVLADLDQGSPDANRRMLPPVMTCSAAPSMSSRWLRLLPPPARLAPLLRRVPAAWQVRLLETAMRRVLAAPLAEGALDLLTARRIGIEVSDLGLRWVVVLHAGRVQVCAPDETAEATVRGTATDLLLLASRREDADTLFFQRRLKLTGDIELGLTARNLLDQLPWQQVPLGLRIALHRGAGLAQAARAAHGGEPMPY